MEQTWERSGAPQRRLTLERAAPRARTSARNVHTGERVASALLGGAALAWAAARPPGPAWAAALLGGGLLQRAITGHCQLYGALGVSTREDARKRLPAAHPDPAFDLARSATIRATPERVYQAFRDPETFQRVLAHFATLEAIEGARSRWTLALPLGRTLSFDTRFVEEQPGSLLRFATLEEAPLELTGGLHLRAAPGDRGTEARLQLRVVAPHGRIGVALTKLLGPAPAWLAERTLHNLKCLIETGELPSLHHNPAARPSART